MTDKKDIIKRIHLIEGIKMSDELFKVKSMEFAEWLINKFGLELINKLDIAIYTKGEYWQFKYVDKI